MNQKSFILLLGLIFSLQLFSQRDTIVVQTFTLDSTSRNAVFSFPTEDPNSYEKVLMHYRMRCHDAQVNTTGGNGIACGEWDYSCNTYIEDPTRIDSLRRTHPTHVISDFNGSVFNYRAEPTYNLIQKVFKDINHTVISETVHAFDLGNEVLSLNTKQAANKFQWLVTKEELLASGLNIGSLDALVLPVTEASSLLNNLKIALKATEDTLIEAGLIDSEGFTEVYYNNYTPSVGDNYFKFFEAFQWDGEQNIIVELSFDSNADSKFTLSGEAKSDKAIVATEQAYFDFTGTGHFEFREMDFEQLQSEITFSMWVKGNTNFFASGNGSILVYGEDAHKNRQVNIHLPWSNKRVYWDCGNDGTGYDRVEKLANGNQYQGRWNHWAFVKNAITGKMDIYVNGDLFTSGTGKNREIELEFLTLGAQISSGNNIYNGLINDFRCFNKALSKAEINAVLVNDSEVLQTLSENIAIDLSEYRDGTLETSSQNNTFSEVNSVFKRKVFGRNLELVGEHTSRPNFLFATGEYTQTINEVTEYDTLFHAAHSIVSYGISNNTVVGIDTTYGYNENKIFVYNDNGNLIDQIDVELTDEISIDELAYYEHSNAKVEIMSFVTPYGINLDLGEDGKTWEFDVTDFAPILTGERRISLERGGQNQEEIDIKFLFITGTPERDILEFHQLWPVTSTSNANILSDTRFEPKTIKLPAEAKNAKIRSVITGHGQEGEFTPRKHHIDVNNGQKRFSWDVWTECAYNPIFPQGGTWVFDRAGWCPGAPSDVQEYELAEFIEPNGEITLDYGMVSATGDSRYIVNHQFMVYGDYNFDTDAEISEIIKPSLRTEYSRFNGACTAPEIRVKNRGGNVINKLTIEYWVDPANKLVYNWEGEILPSQSTNISLPLSESSFWAGAVDNVFHANIASVNNTSDEYPVNNGYASKYVPVSTYKAPLTLSFKTNNRGNEYSYNVYDIEGNIVRSGASFGNNKSINQNLDLENGCYKLEWLDTGEDGLDFWYWDAVGQPRGTGYVHIKDSFGKYQQIFEPDYGGSIIHEFIMDVQNTVAEQENELNLKVFPNPSNTGVFTIYHNYDLNASDKLVVYDQSGRAVKEVTVEPAHKNFSINLTDLDKGVYIAAVKRSGKIIWQEQLVKL